MPAPIVYDGVNGEGSRSRDDLLFSGMKFWLALRVPSRFRFIEKIQSNGGDIVKLERQADILIADDAAPKKAPLNWDSYSWKFIDAAIATGELPDKAAYLIPRPGSVVAQAPAAATGNSKATRTPFTTEDDSVLTECARRQLGAPQAAGLKGSLKGNTFWGEFAAQNPRHTAQSWKDRWLRKLANLPGNDQPLDAGPKQIPPHTSTRSAARTSGQSFPRSRNPEPGTSHQAPDMGIRTSKESSRRIFTEAEDKALIEAVDEARRLGDNIGGRLFYEEFARKYPSHTAESWRSRYHRTLAPRLFPDGLTALEAQPEQIRHGVQKTRHASTDNQNDQRNNSPVQPLQPHSENSKETLDHSLNAETQGIQPQQSRNPSAETHQSINDPEPTERYQSQPQTPITPTRSGLTAIQDDGAEVYRIFYDYLEEYVKSRPNTINTKPCIRGVKVDLYKLQQSVELQETSLEKCDWSRVCGDIGLDSTDHDVVQQVDECYRANLQEFIEALRGFEEGVLAVASPESDKIPPPTSSFEREERRNSDSDEMTEVLIGSASSPPLQRPGKRRTEQKVINGGRKRVRLSRDIEIPDTPQAVARFQHHAAFDQPESSDEDDEDGQVGRGLLNNSPLQHSRSDSDRSGSSQSSHRVSSHDHLNLKATGRNTIQVAEEHESLRHTARGKLQKPGHLPAEPTALPPTLKNTNVSSEASRTVVSAVSRSLDEAEYLPPRSAQPPPVSLRSTHVKKVLEPIKEASFGSQSASTPNMSTKTTAGRFNGMSSPLASIPNDILGEILSSRGPRNQSASFAAYQTPLKQAPGRSRPCDQRNSSVSLHQPQNILPSIEGGQDSVVTSSLFKEIDRLVALGYRKGFIEKLLHATSQNVNLVKKICEEKSRKAFSGHPSAPSESIPHRRGVWTKDDDSKLVSIYEFDCLDDAKKTATARRIRDRDERVLKQKHGFEGALEARRRYLLCQFQKASK